LAVLRAAFKTKNKILVKPPVHQNLKVVSAIKGKIRRILSPLSEEDPNTWERHSFFHRQPSASESGQHTSSISEYMAKSDKTVTR
jgi:hypothetical protein